MNRSIKFKVVVTGANGFVAKNVRNLLFREKFQFIGIARKNFVNYKSETKIITSDFSKPRILQKLKNCQALIHLIGTGRQNVNSTYEDINVNLTTKALKLCKNVNIKKIVYISGLGTSKQSSSAYFISKYKAEQEIINSGLDYTIFRASYIIGKNDPLTKNLNRQIKKGVILIPGSGNYHLQPIFVEDVAKIILLSLFSQKFSNKIIELVGPEKVTFKNFVKHFNRNYKAQIQHIDLEKAYYDALHNRNSNYGVDDLNIMVGDFVGNHAKLKNFYDFEFKTFRNIL